MDKYFYLAAQLPTLQFGQASEISRQDFLTEAEKWLDAKDLVVLKQADLKDFDAAAQDAVLIQKYKEFEYELRRELKSFREARKKQSEYKLPAELAGVLSEGNPLEKECGLCRLRWKFIEDQEFGHYFDLEFLALYFYKIQILEKMVSFDKEEGQKVFNKVCQINLTV
jgi:uncharacterized protein DUF2764